MPAAIRVESSVVVIGVHIVCMVWGHPSSTRGRSTTLISYASHGMCLAVLLGKRCSIVLYVEYGKHTGPSRCYVLQQAMQCHIVYAATKSMHSVHFPLLLRAVVIVHPSVCPTDRLRAGPMTRRLEACT